MKLLFDQNLSHKLCARLEGLYPGSNQVRLLGLDRADDMDVWRRAVQGGHVLVTHDADFRDISTIHGSIDQKGHEPATASADANPPPAEQAQYDLAQRAAADALAENAQGIDPTNGGTNFNLRSNAATGPFQGGTIQTHDGPFTNSFPTSGLPASGIYVNTYKVGG